MKIEDLRNYGKSFSDAEASWPPDVKKWMTATGQRTVLESLNFGEKLRFGLRFLSERRRIAKVDISDIRARGMTNETFLATQRDYVALFSTLTEVVGLERALEIANRIMDRTAVKALGLCFPEPASFLAFEDPFGAFKDWFAPSPAAAREAGSNEIEIVEDEEDTFEYEMTQCVWLDLATRWGAPEACLPNCYSDDLFFPEFFRSFGLEFSRKGTLARGDRCCDYRLERISPRWDR